MKMKKANTSIVGGLVALTASVGLLAITIQSASADPIRPYAAVGSDSSQDLWNAMTNDVGAVAPSVSSYDAFAPGTSGPSFIRTKAGGNWFVRPAGSIEGVKALSAVWDTSYSSHEYPAGGEVLDHEDVDFARSSSGPKTGVGLKYLPFARDAVSIAFKPYSTLTAPLNLTTSQIAELYTGVDDVSDSVVQFSAQPATASTVVTINGVVVHPKIPQNGSGVRQLFMGATGIPYWTTPSHLAPYIPFSDNTIGTGGLAENDGSVLTTGGDLIPFSAAQWIGQENGMSANSTTGLALATINGQSAVSGTAPTLTPGPLYGHKNLSSKYDQVPTPGLGTYWGDVYNVVPTAFLTGTTKQQALVSILGTSVGGAGGASFIQSYGFGVLSYTGDTSKFLDGLYLH